MMYCRWCGKKLIKEWTGLYDEYSGQKTMKDVCPDICKHGYHAYPPRFSTGILMGLWKTFMCKEFCLRCGEERSFNKEGY